MSIPQNPGPESAPEDERPRAGLMVVYGFQHILAMYAGVVTPPIIVGSVVGLSTAEMGILISAALLVSGLATLLQTMGVWRFGARLPSVIGISFVPVSAMVGIAGESGLPTVFGAALVAGVFGLCVVPVMASLIRFFPPVVTGSVITIIGVSLFPVAVGWITENNETGVPTTGGLALAGTTLLLVLLLAWILPGVWSRMAVLGGLVLGTAVAAAFGRVDFSAVGEGAIFSFGRPFHFGPPEFQAAAIITMCVVMLVILTEGVADILAVGEIVGARMDGRRLADGLRVDALASIVGPLLNTFPGSTFSQNVGLVALTRVRSRYVVAVGGLILITLGLFPVLGRIVAMVPSPVLGGAGLVLFGSVAAAGIRTLAAVEYDGNMNLIIVAVALAFGTIPLAAPGFYEGFPSWAAMILSSGIVAGAVAALVLNACFNILGRKDGGAGATEPADAAGTAEAAEAAESTDATGTAKVGKRPSGSTPQE
ncbi:nucleobase:cation symporter-2 family protein [Nocardiopsis aegyptia]|uniref:Xanthine permease n=1 Tax=Nocardiopsis aegyptia TaxID=220378 RepID=A0A7Z0ESW1_9ACTN|nr:nucleobase:cation symporter-2 family protein [Nocardiopsis aegyptia]NYJ37657.1 xanthine permease [Nocardiopsis aegyptia]